MSNASVKHPVTFDGEPVTREVSIGDVKTYMVRKGFTRREQLASGETWAFTAGKKFSPETPCVGFLKAAEGQQDEIRRAVFWVARCLNREPRDVLREITGEVVVLTDAWNALVALLPKGARTSADVPYFGADADSTMYYAASWRGIALAQRRDPHMADATRATWLRVAHAAEDLTAIALSDLKRERTGK